MEYSSLLHKKLLGGDKCLASILGQVVNDKGRSPYVVAVIKCGDHDEHGLFAYSCGQISTNNPDELILEKTLTVDDNFKFSIIAPSQSHSLTEDSDLLPVRFQNSQASLLIELPKDASGKFLSEVKSARQVQSQNAGFGLPSSFTWIAAYTNKTKASSSSNPFLEDVFNPTHFGGASQNPENWLNQVLKQPPNQCPVVPAEYPPNLLRKGATKRRETYPRGKVVDDTTGTDRSPSLRGAVSDHDITDSWTGYEGNGVISKTTAGGDLEISIKRSYDKNLDDLGDMPPTPMGGRENIIKLVMKQRDDEYTNVTNYRVFCGTWNTNGQNASEPVKEWLAPLEDAEPPDIYAIGFQELDLSKSAFMFAESPKEDEWYKRLKEGLHPKAKYQKVKLIRLVGMMLVVFVRKELANDVFNVSAESVGTGILGMMGNKGGVAIRFEFHDTSFCFVNTHLAAHTEEYERRNQDFRDISSKMNFTSRGASFGISDHDLVFWIGDLNYRLSDVDNETVKKSIKNGKLHDLMAYDQLCRQIAMKKVFLDYVEGRITFIPTYKYDPGSDDWDTSEKCRTPAWCDRILYRGANIHQLCYRSHPKCRLSDHKPVSSLFDAGVKVIDREKYRRVYEDVMKTLDRWENEFLPQVSLDITDVNFENVKYIEPMSKTATLTNIGQVPVDLAFINKPGDNSPCKPWLTVEPSRAVINVGASAELHLEVYVNKTTAPKLNSGKDTMEDILVLHLEGGKDLFITVAGSYLPSSFGSSIEALVHMYGPIREIETAQLINLEKAPGSPTGDRPLDIPKEIYRLVDYLFKYGLQQEDLFQQPGLHSEIQLIRDCLDTGTPSEIPGSVHSAAEALLMFLESLAEPVIPNMFYNKCLESCSNFTLCKQVLAQVPQSHRNVFKYLCAFLRKVLRSPSKNHPDAKFLATLFSGLVLRAPSSSHEASVSARREESRKRSCFVYHFLANEYDE